MITAFCCTKNWYKYLLVDIFALLSTNDVKKIYLFIEDDELKGLDELKEFNVKFVVINYKKNIDKYINPNNKNKTILYTEAALIRLIMCNYIDEEKVLYIDTDTCVIGDLNELWNLDLKDNYIAAVKETDAGDFLEYFESINIDSSKYVNTGILLMNNKKIKEDNIYKKWLTLLNKDKYRFPDQDIINLLCMERILYVDNKFNSSTATGFSDSMKIIHYVFKKTDWVKNHYLGKIWYDWERRYNNYLEHHNERTDEVDIDLIICIYNGKKFLRRALDSVKEQTIINKVLLTIIDDGSTEDYGDIIKEYSKYININYHKFRKNKGIGYAREYALKSTYNKYFTFIDSDDYFYDKRAIERLYRIIINNHKCSACVGRIYNEKTNRELLSFSFVYGVIYRRETVNKLKLHFLKERCNEDVYFNSMFYSQIKSDELEIMNSIIAVHTCDNEVSITHSKNIEEEILKNMKFMIKKINSKNYNDDYIYRIFKSFYMYDAENTFKDINNRILFNKLAKKFYQIFQDAIDRHIHIDLTKEEVRKIDNYIKKILTY